MGDRTETLAAHISDVHALEKHLLEAFERQLSITSDMPEANQVVERLVATSKRHADALQTLGESTGDVSKGVADAVKTAVAGVFGVAAGAIDAVRTQSVAKALRDSYTALNHAVIAYVMLQTTGNALSSPATADLAARHLQDTIENAQAVASVIPSIVVKELRDDVPLLDETAAATVTEDEKFAGLYRQLGA